MKNTLIAILSTWLLLASLPATAEDFIPSDETPCPPDTEITLQVEARFHKIIICSDRLMAIFAYPPDGNPLLIAVSKEGNAYRGEGYLLDLDRKTLAIAQADGSEAIDYLRDPRIEEWMAIANNSALKGDFDTAIINYNRVLKASQDPCDVAPATQLRDAAQQAKDLIKRGNRKSAAIRLFRKIFEDPARLDALESQCGV